MTIFGEVLRKAGKPLKAVENQRFTTASNIFPQSEVLMKAAPSNSASLLTQLILISGFVHFDVTWSAIGADLIEVLFLTCGAVRSEPGELFCASWNQSACSSSLRKGIQSRRQAKSPGYSPGLYFLLHNFYLVQLCISFQHSVLLNYITLFPVFQGILKIF